MKFKYLKLSAILSFYVLHIDDCLIIMVKLININWNNGVSYKKYINHCQLGPLHIWLFSFYIDILVFF